MIICILRCINELHPNGLGLVGGSCKVLSIWLPCTITMWVPAAVSGSSTAVSRARSWFFVSLGCALQPLGSLWLMRCCESSTYVRNQRLAFLAVDTVRRFRDVADGEAFLVLWIGDGRSIGD